MKKSGKKIPVYNIINIIVIAVSAVLFFLQYRDFRGLFQGLGAARILSIILVALLVHSVKAGRLYLVLYGSGISHRAFLKTYCKVTPVSVILPFKAGELFRMYCYGTQLHSVLKGVIVIVLDRFMDTIALVTMIFLVTGISGGQIAPITYFLLIFLVISFLIYIAFPGIFGFWKKTLLTSQATEHKLALLKILETLNRIYQEIRAVSGGRGVILYFLSLAAWGVELGSIIIGTPVSQRGALNRKIFQYLTCAISGEQSPELQQFVVVSVILLILIYAAAKIVYEIRGRRLQTDRDTNIEKSA